MDYRLAALTLDDVQTVREWREGCREALRTPFLLTEPMQAAFYRDVICNPASPHRYFAIVDHDRLVAMGGMTRIEHENGLGEISLIVNPHPTIGGGVGRASVALLLEEAFDRLRLLTVVGECYRCNDGAFGFWKKMVDEFQGASTELPRRKFWNGRLWDAYYFWWTAESWRAREPRAS